MRRRNLLIALINVGSLGIAAVVGIPTAMYALGPMTKQRRNPKWRPIGPVDRFPIGAMSEALIGDGDSANGEAKGKLPKSVYVWRESEEEIIVFSRSCTDLGCPVTFDQGSHCFLCPCHGGIFNRSGDRMAGPPDRPLYRYSCRVRDAVVEIDLASVPPMV